MDLGVGEKPRPEALRSSLTDKGRFAFALAVAGVLCYDRVTTNAPPIGTAPFVDCTTRPVFLEMDGRKYVFDGEDQPVFGV